MAILAFAYACDPGEGSEPGAGWDWVRLLASLDETIVITRANNASVIQHHLSRTREKDRISFVYVDLPPWARWWKHGGRGVRVYYLLWQVAALRAARRLGQRPDMTWHLTFANLWLGSLASLVGGKFVLGPVGGGVAPPVRLLPVLGIRGAAFEVMRMAAKGIARYVNPLARVAWRRADLILVQNRETRAWLPPRYRAKTLVFPNALGSEAKSASPVERSGTPPVLLMASRLVAWKGGVLAVRVLEQLPEWRLLICGRGSDERRMRDLASAIGVSSRIEFRGWVDRRELIRIMREEAHVLVVPSVREEAGLVVAEAGAAGLPVVCLDRGGPPLLGGYAVAISSPSRTAAALAAAITMARQHGPRVVSTRSEQLLRLQRILRARGLSTEAMV